MQHCMKMKGQATITFTKIKTLCGNCVRTQLNCVRKHPNTKYLNDPPQYSDKGYCQNGWCIRRNRGPGIA